jgi:hypothetical protein
MTGIGPSNAPQTRPVTFTLDTNCLIDVAEERPAATSIRTLLSAQRAGKACLALVVSSASERQLGGGFLQNIQAFNERRKALGFGDLPLLPSISRWDVSFFGHGLYGSKEGMAREKEIYSTLFPASPFQWTDYAAAKGEDPKAVPSPAYLRWRNQILDAQALWAHDHAARDIFVTSDVRLKRMNGHKEFPKMTIMTPEEASSAL